MLFRELSTGTRDRGAPKKRYKDSLRKSLGACQIDERQWHTLATDGLPGEALFTRLPLPSRRSAGANSGKRGGGGRTKMPQQHPTHRKHSLASAATEYASRESALPVTCEHVTDVDSPLRDLRHRSQPHTHVHVCAIVHIDIFSAFEPSLITLPHCPCLVV